MTQRPKFMWVDRQGPRYVSEEEVTPDQFIKEVLVDLETGAPNYDQAIGDEDSKRFYKEGHLIGFIPRNKDQLQPLRFIRVFCDSRDPDKDQWEIITFGEDGKK